VAKTKTLHQTYDNIADDYSNSIAIINAFQGKFYTKNMPRKRGSVLDVGCGTGDILRQLSKHFEQSFGIDPLKKFVTIAKQRAIDATIQIGDAEDLPFESESMDYIISHVVFQHVDREIAIREAVRVLRPGGRLIISEVLSNSGSRQQSTFAFYRRMLFNYYLVTRHGIKRAKKAKAYQTSPAWKELTSIHQSRRFDLTQLRDFYSKTLPGAKFKSLDSKIVAIIWDKP
jgi:ubiquinone/menaquinone biosynthesis C-methylase UbiE